MSLTNSSVKVNLLSVVYQGPNNRNSNRVFVTVTNGYISFVYNRPLKHSVSLSRSFGLFFYRKIHFQTSYSSFQMISLHKFRISGLGQNLCLWMNDLSFIFSQTSLIPIIEPYVDDFLIIIRDLTQLYWSQLVPSLSYQRVQFISHDKDSWSSHILVLNMNWELKKDESNGENVHECKVWRPNRSLLDEKLLKCVRSNFAWAEKTISLINSAVKVNLVSVVFQGQNNPNASRLSVKITNGYNSSVFNRPLKHSVTLSSSFWLFSDMKIQFQTS
jgi:hypothetical protein